MRVVFAGTPEFAAQALAAIHEAGHEIPLVLTQPDRPAGRGLKLQASAVKALANELGAPVVQPRSLRLDGRFAADAADTREALLAACPDVMVVAAYGLILPAWVLDLPAHGCLNIHASLLPRWRGAAPIQRAIEAGDKQTGITIMQMNAGLDTGDMLITGAHDITPDDTAATLHERLSVLGAELIVSALEALPRGELHAVPQSGEGATYARKIDKAEGAIDWNQPAEVIERRVRAFDPFPGATAVWPGGSIKVWRAVVASGPAVAPGTVLDVGQGRLAVACADNALELLEVQRAGGRRMSTSAYLQSVGQAGPQPGMRLIGT